MKIAFSALLIAGLLLSVLHAQAPATQAAPSTCAIWSNAENRCLREAPPAPAQTPQKRGGVQPITPPMMIAAQGISDVGDLGNSPFLLAIRRDGETARKADKAPFFVLISTPFSRAATIAFEARRKFVDPAFPSLDALNAGRVQVLISPGSSILTVDTIENVVIKHGDQITRPLEATVIPTVVQTAGGLKKASANGSFTFDFYVFDPMYGALTLVMVGRAGNFEWEMTQDDLSQLK